MAILNKNLISLWSLLDGPSTLLNQIQQEGPDVVFPSAFDVTGLATDCISVANLAVAELFSIRANERIPQVKINTIEASAAFKTAGLMKPDGWTLPSVWDHIAGDYLAKDRWIRIHTNYQYHRDTVLNVLQVSNDKQKVAAKISCLNAEWLQEKIVASGGCAAVMYSEQEWDIHPVGKVAKFEKPIYLNELYKTNEIGEIPSMRNRKPLSGIKILDLTRVIAGPECTRFLSAYGADVLRIDPPNFKEVPALLPDVTVGKRRCFLNLKTDNDKTIFEKLIREAHVLVIGYRADALAKIGLQIDEVQKLNPRLIIAELNAYGWNNDWKFRRGFDSLVQMSTGIAATGSTIFNTSQPTPLPVQALDHGAGFLLAAGICRALAKLISQQTVSHIQCSLVGVSNHLKSTNRPTSLNVNPNPDIFKPYFVEDETAWGRVRRVRPPGIISGIQASWSIPAGILGCDTPAFSS